MHPPVTVLGLSWSAVPWKAQHARKPKATAEGAPLCRRITNRESAARTRQFKALNQQQLRQEVQHLVVSNKEVSCPPLAGLCCWAPTGCCGSDAVTARGKHACSGGSLDHIDGSRLGWQARSSGLRCPSTGHSFLRAAHTRAGNQPAVRGPDAHQEGVRRPAEHAAAVQPRSAGEGGPAALPAVGQRRCCACSGPAHQGEGARSAQL